MPKPKRVPKSTETKRRRTAPKNDKAAPAAAETQEQGPPLRTLRDFTERYLAQWDDFQSIQTKGRSSSAKARAILKEAKKAGIEPDDILWYRDNRGRDPAEIDAETQRRNRMARANKMPIGTQLGLFEDGSTVASAVDRDAGTASTPAERNQLQKEALAAGREAGRTGKSRTSNPWPLKSEAFASWDDGWAEGQKEIADELEPAARAGAKAAGNGSAASAF